MQTTDTNKMIMDAIIQLMLSDDQPTHSKLPSERDLATHLQVSRASIREVMSALSLLGLVETRHGGGNYVGDIQMGGFIQSLAKLIEKKAKAEDLWQVRRMLEAEAIRLIIENVEVDSPLFDQMKEEFVAIALGMKQALDTNDTDLGIVYDTKLHATLFVYSGNAVLQLIAEGIQEILRNLVTYNREILLRSKENGAVLYEQHQQLMQAILAKEEPLATTLLHHHLAYVFQDANSG